MMRTSGFNSDDNICWQFGNKSDRDILWTRQHRSTCPACSLGYGERALASFGRCRSGQRWFWRAAIYLDDKGRKANGFTASEDEAMDAAMAAIRSFRDHQPILAHAHHGWASQELQRLNAAKRAARPASDAKGAPVVEYLYSHERDYDDYDRCSHDYFYRFPITKRTAKRVFYLNKGERIDEHGEPVVSKYDNVVYDVTPTMPAFVDRAKLEADGQIWSRPMRKRFYASWEGLLAERRRIDGRSTPKPTDLAALKEAMANAHPDRGGSNAAFIEARAAYVAARRATR